MFSFRRSGHLPPASERVGVAFVFGVLGGVASAFFLPWQMAELIGFDVAAGILLVLVWSKIAGLDGQQTSTIATPEDNSPAVTTLVVIAAALVSLVGVGLALVKAQASSAPMEVAMTILAVATVALAWWTVHTTFVLRYAHLYYRDDDGGVDFGDDAMPDYRDFLYLAVTIGMTFQVSDTDVTDRSIRRQVTHHALISFVFGTVIIGLTINVMAGLVR